MLYMSDKPHLAYVDRNECNVVGFKMRLYKHGFKIVFMSNKVICQNLKSMLGGGMNVMGFLKSM